MTRDAFLGVLQDAPLIASVQASEGSPLGDPETLLQLARASVSQGCRVLRLEGVASITRIRSELGTPTIGLIKERYPNSEVYITPTLTEVHELIKTGCEVIAVDGTSRQRPGGATRAALIAAAHEAGRLVMADCDSLDSALSSVSDGADFVGTTLAGYMGGATPHGPDLELVRQILSRTRVPVIAEGRFAEPWQAQAALRIGAAGVVVGGALNDPVKQTARFIGAVKPWPDDVGAFDIGGTWIRFGLFAPDWRLLHSEKEPVPKGREERLDWMRERVERHRLVRVGVSTGGTVDPSTNAVTEAKPLIPDHVGTRFGDLCERVVALNDGLATAWGHACLPQFAGRRVATVALGTGVGCGLVDRGRIFMGRSGEYSRLNDLAAADETFESLLGGLSLGKEPSVQERGSANEALAGAISLIEGLYLPEAIVLCGGVGLSDWLDARSRIELVRSPFGQDAGLFGAAALALFPPTCD